jgi:predicted AlkP superfamily phosphohydrolase/phosphomutase
VNEAPDIIYEEGDHVYTSSGIGNTDIFGLPKKWRAENNTEGIFLAYGDGIKKGVKLTGVSILDIAPTILYVMGIPVPTDIDGRVLKEIFEDDSELAKCEVTYAEIDREKELIIKKTRELKKLKRL